MRSELYIDIFRIRLFLRFIYNLSYFLFNFREMSMPMDGISLKVFGNFPKDRRTTG